ncbi:MAG: T9SS type A sorting domain-containing protein [Thermonemataceae bacterium]
MTPTFYYSAKLNWRPLKLSYTFILVSFLLIGFQLCNYSTLSAAIKIWPAPKGSPISKFYEIRVKQGSGTWKKVPVYDFFNRKEYSTACGMKKTTDTHFGSFESSGDIKVEIRVIGTTVNNYRIRPTNDNIKGTRNGNKITFTMRDKARQLILEVNGNRTRPLAIFSNPPEVNPPTKGTSSIRYFGPGYHKLSGDLTKENSGAIYIAGGAIVEGHINYRRANNIKVYGRGILFNSNDISRGPALKIGDGKGVEVAGITIVNEQDDWGFWLINASDALVKNVKVLSEVRDGIDIINSNDLRIQDCAVLSIDDCLALKGTIWGDGRAIEDVEIYNCVLGKLGQGHPYRFGGESKAPYMRRIKSQYVDIVYNNGCGGVMMVKPTNAITGSEKVAVIREITLENQRIEGSSGDLITIYSHSILNKDLNKFVFKNIKIIADANVNAGRLHGVSSSYVRDVSFINVNDKGTVWTSASQAKLNTNNFVTGVKFSKGNSRLMAAGTDESVASTSPIAPVINELPKGVQVYPNPTQDILKIANTTAETYQITLHDHTGNKVSALQQVGEETQLQLESLPAGIYILRLTGEIDSYVYKILKQ